MLLALTIFLCWLANILFLGKFYVSRKTNMLQMTFAVLDYCASTYGIDSEEFSRVFDNSTARNNFEILILDEDMNTKASNVHNDERVADILLSYFFKENNDLEKVIETDKFSITRTKEETVNSEYIELWGLLNSNYLITIRTPLSGIKDSANIANLFLMYIGIIAIFISVIMIFTISGSITGPILKLVNISDRMAKLDFEAKYDGSDNTEIGLLGQHMNKMSETLENTISELKTANNELKQDLEKRNQIDEMRKEFLSNVSHELKTPIALIQGYAEGLQDCVNDDEESKNYYCDVIIDEAAKMNSLVKSLLQLNELEFGNRVTLSRIDIVEMIKNCIANVDILLKQNEIKAIFDESKSIYVWSDDFMLESVLNNYISNAIHYAKENDNNEKIIKISLDRNNEKIRVNVFNSGDKIPEEALPHLWTKFYKVDKARTREYGGSGVGLSIVKASMEALNERYGVENCDDGVIFWFEADIQNL